jgi:hydroxyacylglutathione hydrolase
LRYNFGMYFKQFYLGCLAHASYLIGGEKEAVVVDPQRDVDQYIEEAARQNLKIKHIIETHLHADFVSGHRELAAKTGAKIYFGWKAKAKFDHVAVHDGDRINIGSVELQFLETPGHTPESISVLVFEANQTEPVIVLTGDTMFIGDVGRPDLLGAVMSAQELAGMLYDSLHEKLMRLPDSVQVYPAHGAGSMCGRNISSETSSTIGQQRKFNYALQPMSRDQFIDMMTTDLPDAPAYFSQDAQLNREGPVSLNELPEPKPLSVEEFQKLTNEGVILLDTRSADQFGTSHIQGSLNIGLGGQFATWTGTLIPLKTPIALIAEDEAHVRETQVRLARVGHENVVGYLNGGILAWHQAHLPLVSTEQITVDELDRRIKEGIARQVLDVRRPGEYKSGHIRDVMHLPLNRLREQSEKLDRSQPISVICAGGYRSSAAASILEQQGFQHVINVVGGMNAWAKSNLEVVQ